MFGFLNIYKPKGITSHDVVGILRRATKIKQIGHTGTLDPFAEGVLPICIGKATRLIEYLDDDKAYIGTVQLCSSTTTYDIEGEVVKTSDKKVSRDEIENVLQIFRGEIIQYPPIYSAIKVNGKKLYEYAREGKDVKIEPRKVNISKLEIINFDETKQSIELHIECSKGTYIRSIANDLGEKLGNWGHLTKLTRIKAGKFDIKDSIILENLNTIQKVQDKLIYPTEKLNLPIIEINDYEKELVSHGMSLKKNFDGNLALLLHKNELIAVVKKNQELLKCAKVFI